MGPEPLDPALYARAKEIYLAASSLAADERDAYLERACGGAEELRREVLQLLEHGEDPARIARTTALGSLRTDAKMPGDRIAPPLPGQVGPYRILEVLGEGGMGVVYLARQEEPIRRDVALKVVATGARSGDVLARFEAERQTLASLDHPNIAKVLDVGADGDGHPYFVMELVRGMPVTDFVAASRLAPREIVALFLPVVRALAHAHRRGVIHRDVKPSNVLVATVQGDPVPKVIDFGVAKALAEPVLATSYRTRAGQLLGTLEYMSPEQARGDLAAVDTRSDVYSLGALLYELLSGRLPVAVADLPLHEAVQRIHEATPAPLRQAGTTGSGRVEEDLDTIVGKCLERDPDRRYGSAGELAEDLERFLQSRPILARPPSRIYQFRTLVRRNRMAFSFAALVFLFLAVFSVTVSVQLGKQRAERRQAELQARRAERISGFLIDLLQAPRQHSGGRDVRVADLLDDAAARIRETLGQDPAVEAEILATLANTYQELDLNSEAEALCREHWELRKARIPENVEGLARARLALGQSRFYQERYDEAEKDARAVLKRMEELDDGDPEIRGDAGSLLGLALRQQGRSEESVAAFEDAIAAYGSKPESDPGAVANVYENLAGTMLQTGELERAEEYVRRTLEVKREMGSRPGVATSEHNLGFVLRAQGRHEEALAHQLESVRIEREMAEELAGLEESPPPVRLGDALIGVAGTYRTLERLDEAGAAIREAIDIFDGVDDQPESRGRARYVAAAIAADAGDSPEALRLLDEAEAILRASIGESSPLMTRLQDLRRKLRDDAAATADGPPPTD